MTTALITCAVVLYSRSLWVTVRAVAVLSWLRRGAKSDETRQPLEPLVIILPAFREQTLVRETLSHYVRMDYPPSLFRLIIVTNRRERDQREELRVTLPAFADRVWETIRKGGSYEALLTGHLPGAMVRALWDHRHDLKSREDTHAAVRAIFDTTTVTADLVSSVIREMTPPNNEPVAVHVEYSGDELFKVGQVRFAFDNISRILAGWPYARAVSYAGIYDFDARPRIDVLRAVSNAAQRRPAAIQQVPLPVPTRAGRPGRLNRIFTITDASMHMRRSLGIETWDLVFDRWIAKYLRGVAAMIIRPAAYGIGSGLFLRIDALAEIGGLPQVVDDLGVGWRLAFLDQRIEPVPIPLSYEAYQSPRQAADSRAFIYRGYLRVFEDYRILSGKRVHGSGLLLAKVWGRAAQWPLGAPFSIAILVATGFAQPAFTAILLMLMYVNVAVACTIARPAWRLAGFSERIAFPYVLTTFLLAPAQPLWNGRGPRRFLARSAVGRRQTQAGKTER